MDDDEENVGDDDEEDSYSNELGSSHPSTSPSSKHRRQRGQGQRQRRGVETISSSSSGSVSGSDDEEDDDDDEESDDEDEEEVEDQEEEEEEEDGPREKGSFTSEFDRALHRGVGPAKGILGPQTYPTVPPPPPPAVAKKSALKGTHTKNHHLPHTRSTNSASNNDNNTKSHKDDGTVNPNRKNTTNSKNNVKASTVPSAMKTMTSTFYATEEDPLASGVLPDVLMTMRQKIESLTLFDSDMMKLVHGNNHIVDGADPEDQETRESLKRSSQQSISAAVLVSLAHKRYERRRLAAMEIEKVVRSLVQQQELDRVRAILLLLSDDYVRSTSEDARKGGVVALAASAIGLKKAPPDHWLAKECRDLILASVVHACQDHSQRVRYYATESLFNVVKVIPSLAVQHFFILFEILRSLYADVDLDVKSGAELLDKKLKEVIVGAMNSGQFTADACVPVFARFVYMRNKATKRLTLTWLQELAEKLIGAPILEFLHLLLAGIFDMVADPTLAIRQSALAFLQSVLPKLLTMENHVQEEAIDDLGQGGVKVDFDKILQSLVTTMEHPDPFVRKVAMYWMSRIVKAHIDGPTTDPQENNKPMDEKVDDKKTTGPPQLSAATISVRNSLPHVLPGILLSIGDTFKSNSLVKDSFLPDQTTHALAEQTNTCLQEAVRRDGQAYVHHLDSFIVALREELDSPGGVNARTPPAMERKPYRMDVKHDGTGIESQGWFRASNDTKEDDVDSMMMSRLCALHWVIVLYESVVPDVLKADYAREFVVPIIHQLVDHPPEQIIDKSLEVLATITVPVKGEAPYSKIYSNNSSNHQVDERGEDDSPMTDGSVNFALDILDENRQLMQSRDREVFTVLIQLHAYNLHLIGNVAKVISYMCRLQPAEFIFVSFAIELERFAARQSAQQISMMGPPKDQPLSRDLHFVSSFIQQMCHVILNSRETKSLREVLRDCIGDDRGDSERHRRRTRLFQILLHCFAHNLVASTALCLWGGAYRTASLFLKNIDPLDINLMFLLEVDKLVEMIERPIFRYVLSSLAAVYTLRLIY